MFCSTCGSQMSESSKWCTNCGQKISVEVQEPQAQIRPLNQVQQQIRDQQSPTYQAQQNYGLAPSLTGSTTLISKGLLGILGGLIFLFSSIVYTALMAQELRGYNFKEIVLRLKTQTPCIELLCIAGLALLLVIFSCSKTVFLLAVYCLYAYINQLVLVIEFSNYNSPSKNFMYIITIVLGLIGLLLLVVNVFKDKRKQRI